MEGTNKKSSLSSKSAADEESSSGGLRKRTPPPASKKKLSTVDTLIVFGGTGFVGSAVLKAALSSHESLQIIVVSRRSEPPAYYRSDPILSKGSNRLFFVAGDLVRQSQAELQQALYPWTRNPHNRFLGCISCVGVITPFDNHNMEVTNGDANILGYKICRTLPGNNNHKFVVMTRDPTNWNDWWYICPSFNPGYFDGKRKIESFLSSDIEHQGLAVCFRAGYVVGIRRTIPGISKQISWIYVPLQCPCCCAKTIQVDDLGEAAVRFVLSETKSPKVLIENDEVSSFFR